MNHEYIHKNLVQNIDQLSSWYKNKCETLGFPIYSSFDIRDSGEKVCPVDANLFPAGFNNICQIDRENAQVLMKDYLDRNFPQTQKIALITEEHTNNLYYWDNVYSVVEILSAGNRYEPLSRTLRRCRSACEKLATVKLVPITA